MSHDKLCSLSYIWKFKVVLFHLLLRISGTSCCNLFVFEEWDNGKKKSLATIKKKNERKNWCNLNTSWLFSGTSRTLQLMSCDSQRTTAVSVQRLLTIYDPVQRPSEAVSAGYFWPQIWKSENHSEWLQQSWKHGGFWANEPLLPGHMTPLFYFCL